MPNPVHPARSIPFADLMVGLERAHALGFVYRRADKAGRLLQFTYSSRCVYEDGWDDFTLLARGLIVDPVAKEIVATPFPKFFNLGERHGEVPDGPFEAFEKLDGSLIIVFHHNRRWQAAKKGSFDSEQAVSIKQAGSGRSDRSRKRNYLSFRGRISRKPNYRSV